MDAFKDLTVGIIGTGPIGLGYAALLATKNLEPMIWSPSGNYSNAQTLVVSGAVQHSFTPKSAPTAQHLVAAADIIIIAVPAYGHKNVMDQIAGSLRSDQSVIISSHVPFASEYLQAKLAERDVESLIMALSTTVLSGRKTDATHINIGTVRDQIDMAALPNNRADEGLKLCQHLFGDRFVLRDSLMAIALSNLNPQNHLGIALCNLTRIEKGESWIQAENITPAVGRLLEQLDSERLAIAQALNLKVRNIYEHFSRSFHVPRASVAEMSAMMVENGHSGCGPTTLQTRYVLEDVPFGLVPIAWLGRCIGTPAPLHESGITLFNALYGRDFFSENNLMNALKTTTKTDSGMLKLLGGHTYNQNWQGRADQSGNAPHNVLI